MWNHAYTMGNGLVVLQEAKCKITMWPSNSIPRYLPWKIENRYSNKTWTWMFLELFTIAKRWKQPNYLIADKWINKMWSVHTMEYYSAIRRNEVLICAMTWINLENIMLRERARHTMSHLIWFCLSEIFRIGESRKTWSEFVVARVGGEEGMGSACIMDFSFLG